jgi:hypothetical protein
MGRKRTVKLIAQCQLGEPPELPRELEWDLGGAAEPDVPTFAVFLDPYQPTFAAAAPN